MSHGEELKERGIFIYLGGKISDCESIYRCLQVVVQMSHGRVDFAGV